MKQQELYLSYEKKLRQYTSEKNVMDEILWSYPLLGLTWSLREVELNFLCIPPLLSAGEGGQQKHRSGLMFAGCSPSILASHVPCVSENLKVKNLSRGFCGKKKSRFSRVEHLNNSRCFLVCFSSLPGLGIRQQPRWTPNVEVLNSSIWSTFCLFVVTFFYGFDSIPWDEIHHH